MSTKNTYNSKARQFWRDCKLLVAYVAKVAVGLLAVYVATETAVRLMGA